MPGLDWGLPDSPPQLLPGRGGGRPASLVLALNGRGDAPSAVVVFDGETRYGALRGMDLLEGAALSGPAPRTELRPLAE